MLTELQKKAAQAIVNIFETGRVQGEYGQVTLLPGDSGHLTYGRSQTTLASGNLYLLIKAYCDSPGAQCATDLHGYLEKLDDRDLALDNDMGFRRILREAGNDPVMCSVQDSFFDRVYWNPAERSAGNIGVNNALGVDVVYDSHIHGSWQRMRDRTNDRYGTVSNLGENEWIQRYIEVRRDWLTHHSNTLLHRTVYRMDSFRDLIGEGKWGLELPFRVRGILIDEAALEPEGDARAAEENEEPRPLRLRQPNLQGDDVRELQQALSDASFTVEVDGVFGPETEAAVRRLQEREGLQADGIVGPATRAALDL
jgi:chitosanase